MSHTLIGRILEPLGLYQINNTYLTPVNRRLETLEGSFSATGEILKCLSQLINDLKQEDKSAAIVTAMEFLDIEEECDELQRIHQFIFTLQTA